MKCWGFALFFCVVSCWAQEPVVTCISVSDREAVFSVQSSGFDLQSTLIQGKKWSYPKVDGCPFLMEKGAPHLPIVVQNVMLPSSGDARVRVKVLAWTDYPLTPVAPSKGFLPRKVDPSSVPYEFGSMYQEDYFPQEIAPAGDPFVLRDIRGMTVRICPFRYFPKTQVLRHFTELEVAVAWDSAVVASQALMRMAPAGNAVGGFASIYAERFINYSQSVSSTLRYSPVPEAPARMLVIAADHLVDAMDPFVTWKNQRGIATQIVALSAVGSCAADIKDYVRTCYENEGLTYLLLVGDAEDVPSFVTEVDGELCCFDPDYSTVAGEDDYPDLFVGRFSGSSADQISVMVTRSIAYERDAAAGVTAWGRAVGIASAEGSGPSDSEHMDSVRTLLLTNGYLSVDQLYDPDVTPEQVAEVIHAGRGLMNYVGHGDYSEWVTSAFLNEDVNALTNTLYWPVIFDVACLNGHFRGRTAFAEAWLNATDEGVPTGAAAVYASTISQDWIPPMAAQTEFNRLLGSGSIYSFGALCFSGSMKMIDDYGANGVSNFMGWTVFGDPSLMVRTQAPRELSVEVEVTGDAVSLQVADALPGAWAALSYEGRLISGGAVAESGSALLTIDDLTNEEMLLTVVAPNAVSWQTNLFIYCSQFDGSISEICVTNMPTQTTTVPLVISNTGDSNSVLTYACSLEPVFPSEQETSSSLSMADERSLAGATISVSPTLFTFDSVYDLTVSVRNASFDSEWVHSLTLDFPASCTVLSATDIVEDSWGLRWDGVTGTGVSVSWVADDYEEIEALGTGTVRLTVAPVAVDEVVIPWTMSGDEYGEDPHDVSGTLHLVAEAPSLQLQQPSGGESWEIGSTQRVEWCEDADTQLVDLFFSSDGGAQWTVVETELPAIGTYDWVVNGTQSDQCYFKVVSTDGSLSSRMEVPFEIYSKLDWIALSSASGRIEANESAEVTVSLAAGALPPGVYCADLVIQHSVGTTRIPLQMMVKDRDFCVLTATSGSNGSVTPSGDSNILFGGSTNVVISADDGYYIRSVSVDGDFIGTCEGGTVYTAECERVYADVDVVASFADSQQDSADYGVPYPWLRKWYVEAADLSALNALAAQDCDGDGAAAWQEYVAGTDPTDSASVLKLLLNSQSGGNELRWTAQAERLYTLYYGADLANGLTNVLRVYFPPCSPSLSFFDSPPAEEPQRFYRVAVELNKDTP